MTADRPTTAVEGTHKPAFRMFNMVLFSVCAILLLSQLNLTASIGPSAIFWTVIIIVIFFAPYGLVTAELGSTYPQDGGIYQWIVRAFGKNWGTRVSWWYWINVALWVPSVYLIFSGAISSMFFKGEMNFWLQIAITVVLIWVAFWINARSLRTATWVSNVGAGITVAVIIALAIIGGVYAANHGSATEWTASTMLPTKEVLPAVALALPIIIYNFLGFELMSSASSEMENPRRDVPRSIAIAGILIGGFYLLATVGMQLILKADEVSETQGFFDAMKLALGESAGATAFINILGIGSLYCFFACLIPWTIGANLAARESAQAGDMPKFFARSHPVRHTPIGAALLCSIIGTVFTVVYAILFQATDGGIDDVFWSLFAFSSLIFLLPYIAMMLAFRKLRRVDPNAHRPYRVPGGDGWASVMAWVPAVLLALSAMFFAWNPWDFNKTLTIGIAIGVVLTVAIQEYFVFKAPSWRRARALERGEDPDGVLLSTQDAPAQDPDYGSPL